MRLAAIGLLMVLSLALVGTGCGSEEGSERTGSFEAQQAGEAAQARHQRRRARQRRAAQRRARHHAQLVAARERQAREQRKAEAREAAEAARIEEEEVEETEASECDPSYAGACLDPYAYDYDCEGGSGDGPEYTGTVSVVGEDHFDLDRDSDGVGCELE